MSETETAEAAGIRDVIYAEILADFASLFPDESRVVNAAADRIAHRIVRRLAAAPAEPDAGMVVVSRATAHAALMWSEAAVKEQWWPLTDDPAIAELRAALGDST